MRAGRLKEILLCLPLKFYRLYTVGRIRTDEFVVATIAVRTVRSSPFGLAGWSFGALFSLLAIYRASGEVAVATVAAI